MAPYGTQSIVSPIRAITGRDEGPLFLFPFYQFYFQHISMYETKIIWDKIWLGYLVVLFEVMDMMLARLDGLFDSTI